MDQLDATTRLSLKVTPSLVLLLSLRITVSSVPVHIAHISWEIAQLQFCP